MVRVIVKHEPPCTWSGRLPPHPGWDELNYVWCMYTCERPVREIDYNLLYESSRGNDWGRLIYDVMVMIAKRFDSRWWSNLAKLWANRRCAWSHWRKTYA